MQSRFGIAKTDAQYASDWALESADYARQGAYEWMASRLAGMGRVLEIGCGSGEGTTALVQQGNRVVAVELNASARSLTLQRLATAGIVGVVVSSLEAAMQRPEEVVLIESEFLGDVANHPGALALNAIACWNIGAAPGLIASWHGTPVNALPGDAFAGYRGAVQAAAYAMAARTMQQGSQVSVVDRTVFVSTFEKQLATQVGQAQQELAGAAVRILTNRVTFFPYTIPKSATNYIAQAKLPQNGKPAFVGSMGML